MKSRKRRDWTAPVVSHWGISGGRFAELAGPTAFGFVVEQGAAEWSGLIRGWNGFPEFLRPSASCGAATILRDVMLHVDDGVVVAVIGANGRVRPH